MAGVGVGLTTGSNAKLRVNGKTMAYAVDVQYATDVATIPAEVMGKFEVVNNEPVAYSVAGSFSILRYVHESAVNADLPNIDTTKSNSPGHWANTQLNPGGMLTSTTFDLEILQKFVNDPNQDATDPGKEESIKIVKIHDCRITKRRGSVNKRGMYMEAFSFVGILMDDDKSEVSHSGIAFSDDVV